VLTGCHRAYHRTTYNIDMNDRFPDCLLGGRWAAERDGSNSVAKLSGDDCRDLD
jgi:hypothetical protein